VSRLRLQVNSRLASRMRAVIGAIAFCRATDRQLIIHWPHLDESEDAGKFPCNMDDIWQHPYVEIHGDTSHWTSSLNSDLRSAGNLRYRTCHIAEWVEYFRRPIGDYLNELQPTAALAEAIAAVDILEGVPLVGVVIRNHNRQKHTQPLDWFLGRMSDLRKLQPAVHFVVSADCEETEGAVKACFGGAVHMQQKSYRYDQEGIIKWAADLYLLRDTHWVVGSTRSSFSQLVAFMRGASRVGQLHDQNGSVAGGGYEDTWHGTTERKVRAALNAT